MAVIQPQRIHFESGDEDKLVCQNFPDPAKNPPFFSAMVPYAEMYFRSANQAYEFGRRLMIEAERELNRQTREADKMIGEGSELSEYRKAKGRG